MIDAAHDTIGVVAPDAAELARLAKAHAYAIGFDLVGIAALGPAETAPEFDAWLRDGRAGAMHYLERGAEKRAGARVRGCGRA